jgi:hypothetical protein
MGMPVGNGKTFDQFCFGRRVTKEERAELAWHLAAIRARRLIESLLQPSKDKP